MRSRPPPRASASEPTGAASRAIAIPARSVARYVWGTCPAAIEIEALREALRRATWHSTGSRCACPPGTVYGFLGPNGAGKTTTMRILLGLLRADAGTARVLGRDPWSDGLAVRGADRVPAVRSRACTERMRGRAAARLLQRRSTARRRSRRDELCTALRLSDADLDRPVRGYWRVRRKAHDRTGASAPIPELALLNEPTEGLDPLRAGRLRSDARALPAPRGPDDVPLIHTCCRRWRSCGPGRDHPRRPDRRRRHDRGAAGNRPRQVTVRLEGRRRAAGVRARPRPPRRGVRAPRRAGRRTAARAGGARAARRADRGAGLDEHLRP